MNQSTMMESIALESNITGTAIIPHEEDYVMVEDSDDDDDVMEVDEDSYDMCDEEDDLAMLIGNKRRREEEVREFAQQIGEEMAMEMDTGIRVNEDLRKALC